MKTKHSILRKGSFPPSPTGTPRRDGGESSIPRKIIGVIPARYTSTRFPGKALIPIDGIPMVARVYFQVERVSLLDSVVVATDSKRVVEAMEVLDIPVVLTSSGCRTGSDRVAEVARNGDGDIYVNIQGDEPFIEVGVIEKAVEPFLTNGELKMGTIASTALTAEEWTDRNVVKVRVNKDDFAEEFFRTSPESFLPAHTYKHIGLYVFEKSFLLEFSRMKRTVQEKERHLEQLRAMDYGIPIKVVLTNYNDFSIDTPEDLQHVQEILGLG